MTNTGKDYEKLIAAIYDVAVRVEGIRNIKVLQNARIEGMTRSSDGSPNWHQIDVYWEFELAGIVYKAIVQAKDWQTRITKEKVLAFKAVLNDIPGQPRGIMISRSGFQSGAAEFAQEHGIELYTLERLEKKTADLTKMNVVVGEWSAQYLKDLTIHFDEQWLREEKPNVSKLMEHFDPQSAITTNREGTVSRDLSVVFANIRGVAVLTGNKGRIFNAFDEPVILRSPNMPEGVIIAGISAEVVAGRQETVSYDVDLADFFTLTLRKITGSQTFYVDREYRLHESGLVSATGFCDFCGIPIPDDDSNLFYAQRTVSIRVGDDGEPGPATAWEAGDWGACVTCADLIRKGQKPELLARATRVIKENLPKANIEHTREAHDAFWFGYSPEAESQ